MTFSFLDKTNDDVKVMAVEKLRAFKKTELVMHKCRFLAAFMRSTQTMTGSPVQKAAPGKTFKSPDYYDDKAALCADLLQHPSRIKVPGYDMRDKREQPRVTAYDGFVGNVEWVKTSAGKQVTAYDDFADGVRNMCGAYHNKHPSFPVVTPTVPFGNPFAE